ncbi:ATP-grasp fold amidoligase family protein [Flavobacterium proteolyticum]|uniref:Glycosyltransferase n=1 Tax=Flavobacterium proteolyticum TaxID=2911683 RepID=A0ABR9WQN3_9FLAO|nr:ATP-grasp fold amidoligase family protein [Flavobacterium proteolyticum]MBE9576226.1 glycosyltransferase [Flavobacterium proteolyticum]
MFFFKRKCIKLYLNLLKFINASDEMISIYQYYLKNGKKPDLVNPKEFMEKTLWLKLNYYTESYGKYADKYDVRNHVERTIGGKYLNDIFGVYDSVSEISFTDLPQQFVLKGTHGSGYNIIVKDRDNLNLEKVKKKLNQYLSENYYHKFREKIYKDLKPRILIEKYITEIDSEELIDYKFHCFHGKPKYVFVQKNKSENIRKCFYDLNWNKVLPETYNSSFYKADFKKPENFDEMVQIAEKLSEGFVFLRVDLYSIGHKIIFGELTFFSNAGLIRSSIERFNIEFGDLIQLPK